MHEIVGKDWDMINIDLLNFNFKIQDNEYKAAWPLDA